MKRLEITRSSLSASLGQNSMPDVQEYDATENDDQIGPGASTDDFAIFIIEPRLLIRECLTRALRDIAKNSFVLSFPSVAEWKSFHKRHIGNAVILFCLGSQARSRAEIEQELITLNDSGTTTYGVLLSEEEDAAYILKALDSGARGYIPMSVPLEVAFEALRLVRAGGVFVPASSLISSRRSIEDSSAPSVRCNGMFTERQAAVVDALRQGKANKIIAYELNMRESTVKVHIRNIMKKLKARNRTEVAYLTNNLFASQGSPWMGEGGSGRQSFK